MRTVLSSSMSSTSALVFTVPSGKRSRELVDVSCHFERFGFAQDRLREKSLFRPEGEICLRSLAFARLCENSVHASRVSARTDCGISKIKYLTLRPELSRRAPI